MMSLQLDTDMEKVNRNPYFTAYKKNSLPVNHGPTCKIVKILQENTGQNFNDFGLIKNFFKKKEKP